MRPRLPAAMLCTIVLTVSSCAGPEAYNRRYLADDFICSIDEAVRVELDRKLPNGYLTREYSPELWSAYWHERVQRLSGADLHGNHPGYVGPTGRALVLYALAQRRQEGLADLSAEGGLGAEIESLYAELEAGEESSCARLAGRNPECSLSPAQYRGSPESRRLVRRCS